MPIDTMTLATHCAVLRATLGIVAGDRVALLNPDEPAAALEQAWSALTAGATLCVTPQPLPVAVELALFLKAERVTVLPLRLALWHELARIPTDDAHLNASLRLVVLTAGRLPAEQVCLGSEAMADVDLWHAYCPADAGLTAALGRVATPQDPDNLAPLAAWRISVRDVYGRLAPLGAPGELVLADSSGGGREIRTGELVRLSPDGRLNLLGPASGNSRPDAGGKKTSNPTMAGESSRSEPTTETELLVARLWGEILEKPQVGRDSDFFELGGHSLAAVQVILRLNEALSRELRVSDLLQRSSVRAFAAFLDGNEPGTGHYQDLPTPRNDVSRTYKPSHAQRRLWFVDQFMTGEAAVYNVPLLLRIPGYLDWDRCTAIWTAMAHRHEALRTLFGKQEGEPVAVVGHAPQIAFCHLDLRATQDANVAMDETFNRDQDLRFDLEQGPLTRVTLIWLPDGSSRMFVNMHHIITDLWSTATLVREFIGSYLGNGEPKGPPRYQYSDYADWERRVASSGDWARHERYLLGELDPPPEPLEISADFGRVPYSSMPERRLTIICQRT